MATQVYETYDGNQLTKDMLAEAAKLFNENYGIWGKDTSRAGKPVILSPGRLREQYLPEGSRTTYIRVTVGKSLAGNLFACRWECEGKHVCWVTQLVVGKTYREQGLATSLLRLLRQGDDDIYGIMSSHPAACLAAAVSFGSTIEKLSLDFIRDNAKVIRSSPIPYIKNAKLCGTLFEPTNSSIISGVDTSFFVDHSEPLEALYALEGTWRWPLGELPDGQEYLLLLPGKRRKRR